MNNKTMPQVHYVRILFALSLILLGSNLCSAQTTSNLLQTFQSLSQDQQNQLIDQIAGQVSSTGNTTGTTTTGTTSGTTSGTTTAPATTGLPPGKAVRAAADGTPIFQGEMFQQPVEQPSFWDNIKTIFLNGLAEAITNITGISTPTPTPTEIPTPTPTPTP